MIDKIGGLDLDFSPAYFDDWDYSMRAMAAGYRCVVALGAFVFHFKNVTYGTCGEKDQINTLLNEKSAIFYKRWGRPLKVLIVDDGVSSDFEARISALLRDQNSIVLVSSRRVGICHTNLHIIRVPRWLMGVAFFLILIDDTRHSVAKRIHLVLGCEEPGSFLKRIFSLFRGYRTCRLRGMPDPSFEVLIRTMKFETV